MTQLALRPAGRCRCNVIPLRAAGTLIASCHTEELPTFEKMVHPGGFEPPTARFVAEYSIQLSYGCIGVYLLGSIFRGTTFYGLTETNLRMLQRMVHPGGLLSLRFALWAVADATLSSLVRPER